MDNTPVREDVTASPIRPGSLGWIIGILAIILVLFFLRATPLALEPPRSENASGQFDTARAIERLGKVLDGTPHPVDRATYDTSIHVLTDAVRKARVGDTDKTEALKRLAAFDRTPRAQPMKSTV